MSKMGWLLGISLVLLLSGAAYSQTDTSYIELVGVFNSTDLVSYEDVFVIDSFAYLASYENGIEIINVSYHHSPSSISTFGCGAYSSFSIDSLIFYSYLGCYHSGVRVMNVSELLAVSEVSNFEDYSVTGDLFYIENKVFVPSGDNLLILDVSDPTSIAEISLTPVVDHIKNLWIQDNYLYCTSGSVSLGLTIYNVSDPLAPAEVCRTDIGHTNYSIYVSDELVYIADGLYGLIIVDVSYPFSPFEVGHVDHLDRVMDVSVIDHYAFVVDDGLRVIDVSDPSDPVEVDFYSESGFGNIYAWENYVYVTKERSLFIFDVSHYIGLENRSPMFSDCFDTIYATSEVEPPDLAELRGTVCDPDEDNVTCRLIEYPEPYRDWWHDSLAVVYPPYCCEYWISFYPSLEDTGYYNFAIEVCDSHGLCDTCAFVVSYMPSDSFETPDTSFGYSIIPGWNMIGSPIHGIHSSFIDTLSPIIPPLFYYDPIGGSYIEIDDSLEYLKGYWILSRDSMNIELP